VPNQGASVDVPQVGLVRDVVDPFDEAYENLAHLEVEFLLVEHTFVCHISDASFSLDVITAHDIDIAGVQNL
jgi:hypothetical protein